MYKPRHSKPSGVNRGLIAILIILTVLVGLAFLPKLILKAPEIPAASSAPVRPQKAPTQSEQAQDTPEEAPPEEDEGLSHQERKSDFYTILVAGTDDGNGGSDTIILLGVDAKGGAIYGVSIPRDTKAHFKDKNHKINAAYNSGGMELLSQVVSDQLGIPVDYTVRVNLKGFVALVDAIGGVDFYVPVNMDYEDPYQDLYIHIPKGMRHLSGSEAIKVVRFREGYASQDIGRMETQQKFLKAVAKQVLRVSNITKIDSFVKIFQSYVKTDLSLGNLAWLANEAISMGPDNISFSTLPGEWNGRDGFIHLDKAAVLEVVNAHLNPFVEDRVAEDLNILS